MKYEVKHGQAASAIVSVSTETIDLVCTDPPYASDADYSTKQGSFQDRFKDMQHYLTMMLPVLHQCHRVLKPTGSLFLIVDEHASAYLKIELDRIFGIQNFRRWIHWTHGRSGGFAGEARNFCKTSYHILYYAKSDQFTFNKEYEPLAESSVIRYNKVDENGRAYMDDSDRRGIGKRTRYYLDESRGAPVTDTWKFAIQGNSDDYPTAKPEKMLERIIRASSNPGETVLDPFCGGGSTLAVAKRLGRSCIGIDANAEAVAMSQSKLTATLLEENKPNSFLETEE